MFLRVGMSVIAGIQGTFFTMKIYNVKMKNISENSSMKIYKSNMSIHMFLRQKKKWQTNLKKTQEICNAQATYSTHALHK